MSEGRRSRAAVFVPLAGLLLAGLGCDDSLTGPWYAAPDTVTLTSLAIPRLNVPAGLDIVTGTSVVLEAPGSTGTWDLYLDTRGDSLVLAPPGFIRIDSDAGIMEITGRDFDDVAEAPDDGGAYVTDAAVTLRAGSVYVVRSRVTTDAYGSPCQYFGKVAPVSLNPARGVAVLVWDRNPYCYDPDLDGSES